MASVDDKELAVDSKHEKAAVDDEAAKVFAQYDGPLEWTEQEENTLRRKIDWKLIPIMCFTSALQYYDKAMLGQAALFGLIKELELRKGDRYSMASSIFYLGFLAGAYPAVILAQRYPLERVTSGLVTLWGICLLLTITCHSYQALYAQRFFLGFLESGISPLFMLMVGSWYRKDEQAFRMGGWYSLAAWSASVAPLINYGIGQIRAVLAPWRWMYIFAGIITVLWGVALLFILPPDPTCASGFSERERYIAVARLRTNNSGVRNTTFKIGQAKELLCDLKFWLMFFIATLSLITNGPVSSFAPLIIQGWGYTSLQTLLLVMPAGVWVGSCTLLAAWLAMRYSHMNIRTYIVFVTQCFTILSAALLWKLHRGEKGGLFFSIYTLSTYGAGYGVLMGLQVANNSGYTKRSLASSGLFVGYCLGNFIGPMVYLEREAPKYDTGFTIVTVASALAAVLILVYRYVCIWDNQRRDRAGTAEGYDHAYEDPTDKENPQFRYIY
ncbi:hypothetical protein BST61_g2918 [Cercospora zeina]